ncbi:MAG TPA: HD domain-containing phosphohydrolase [Bacillota bacterium]|nr:HD domain-containing phosphohydrolase [Bacillota bacterium]
MRKISTGKLKPGTKLGRAVYSSKGGLIIPSGVQIQEAQIQRLLDNGITEVYVDDPRVSDIEIVEPIPDVTRIKAIKELRYAFSAVRSDAKVDVSGLVKIAKEIHDDVVFNNPRIATLIEIKSKDDYLFVHAINVAILATIIARMSGLNANSLDICVGAFLKDLGMAKLPQEVLDRPDHLTAEEQAILKKHADVTINLLKGSSEVSAFAKIVIAQHHERMDGSGYPQAMKDAQIHPLAKIVAIADTYAAMISDRPHRPKHRPFEAIEYIMSAAGFEFDHNFVDVFTKCTVPYPVGSMVRLSDNSKGVVVNLGRGLASRPIIRLFYDRQGNELGAGYELNLSDQSNQTILIAEILDE